MNKSRSYYSVLNILTGLGGYAVNTIVGFICRIIFVRCLSEDYLGINGLFSNVLSILSLAELGIGSAIGYALYKPLAEHDEEKITSLMHFYSKAYKVIGLVVGFIGILIMPFMNVIIRTAPSIDENLKIIYLLYLFNTASTYFFSYRSALLMTAQQSYLVTGISYIQTILQSVLQIAYLLIFKEYYGYLIIQTIGIFLYNIIISKVAVKKYPYIANKAASPLSKDEKKKITQNVRDLTIYKISSLMVNSTDNIIITFFDGLSSTGLTSNYTLFTGTLTTLLSHIFNGVSASIGNFNALHTPKEREQLFYDFNLANFWLYGWASIGVLCVSSDLVRFFYGDHYVMENAIPAALALNMYMVGMQTAVWTFKNTQGIFKYGRFMQMITAGLNIIFSLLLGKIWGAFGVLFASAIARGLTNTWYDPYCIFKYGFYSKFTNYVIRYLKFALVEIVCIISSLFICSKIKLAVFPAIIVKCFVCSIIFNGLSLLLFGRSQEMQFVFNKLTYIIHKFRRIKNG